MTERRPDPKSQASPAVRRMADRLDEILREIESSATLAAELLAKTGTERAAAVRTEVRFHGLKLCELLFTKSREAWFTNPAKSVELAELAVAISDRLDVDHYGMALVEDTRALAWAHLGNAYQVASDLRQAEEALDRAEEHHRHSDEDELTLAQILSFRASLRNAQGRFEEAGRLLDRALVIYREAKDRHLEGRTLIKKATALGYAGRFHQAARLVRRGLSRIDLLEEPRLLVMARHNLIWYLNESGQYEKARKELEETRGLYLALRDQINLVLLRWLEGRIALGLGRLDEAGPALREARDAFIERGIGFDAALVSLDLAAVYARRGEPGQVKRLAAEMLPIFESRDLHAEALAALAIFRQAAEAEEVTLDLLERMARYLQRARRNPELRFGEGE
ncbi:MAG TPA: tetratricopeptide repeat protein [Thermoanaerobaculia bacterium]|nr:tetratricopeptide repeat protein [Thermoanaerobaculia bacterium]